MRIMIVQSISHEGIHQIELKNDKKYAVVRSKGNWVVVFIKCLIKIIFNGRRKNK